MEITVYMHRTKKKQFAVAECFSVNVDLDKLPEDKINDIDYINRGFQNDTRRIAFGTNTIKKFGTGYISFLRPQFEGPEEDNGNEKIYFDNTEMLFKFREVPDEKK